jgi:hypothetical protein
MTQGAVRNRPLRWRGSMLLDCSLAAELSGPSTEVTQLAEAKAYRRDETRQDGATWDGEEGRPRATVFRTGARGHRIISV